MENFFFVVSFLLIGMGLRRLPRFPYESGLVLNQFVIHVSLPALVLLQVRRLHFSTDLLVPVLLPWLLLALSAGLVLLLARARSWPSEVRGALLLLVPLGNTSFLGIPMVRAFFGEIGIPNAILYDQLGTFLALATYGSLVLALHGGERPSPAGISKKIIGFPPFIALLLALLSRPFLLPIAVENLLGMLAATLVPLVMIAVGFQFVLRLQATVLPPLVFGLTVKLLIAPLTALVACRLLGLTDLAAQVAVFEAGMPPMISAGALAIAAGLAPQLSAALVGFGLLLSFVSLPLLFQLI